MNVVKRGKHYYLRIRRGGTEEWITTNRTTRKEAERVAERILLAFDREKQSRSLAKKLCEYALALAKGEIERRELVSPLAMLEKQAMQDAMSVIEEIFPNPPLTAFDLWMTWEDKFAKTTKASTFGTKKQRYAAFIKYAGEMDVRTLNDLLCKRFLKSLNVSVQTQKNYISELSSVFQASPEVNNPWNIRLLEGQKHEAKERPVLSFELAKGLLSFMDANPDRMSRKIPYSRWAQFIRVLYYTGLRPVDVCYLPRSVLVNGSIDLEPIKTNRTEKRVSYKADPKLIPLLQSIPDDGNPLYFPEFAKDYAAGRANLASGFRTILEAADMYHHGIELYGFRHLFITYQIDSGNSEEDVASAVGHVSTETTTKHYYHGKKNVELSEMPEL